MEVIGWFAKNFEIYEKVSRILIPNFTEPINFEIKLIRFPEVEKALLGDEERKEYQRMLSIVENLYGIATKETLKVYISLVGTKKSYIKIRTFWKKCIKLK